MCHILFVIYLSITKKKKKKKTERGEIRKKPQFKKYSQDFKKERLI